MKSTSDPPQSVTITKQDAIDTMRDLPDRFDAEEFLYRLYVLLKIEKAEASISASKTWSPSWVSSMAAENSRVSQAAAELLRPTRTGC